MKSQYDYGFSIWRKDATASAFIKASAIIAEFESAGTPVPESLSHIAAHGIRYSNQDFDVLSACFNRLPESAQNRLMAGAK